MTRSIFAFWRREDGAVTIDWVVLTAATVGLSISTMAVFLSATKSPEGDYNANLSNAQTFVESIK